MAADAATDTVPSMRVGVIADTHGQLRPRVLELLQGCDRILHAGDVGTAAVLAELRRVAPVLAVRGNVDDGPVVRDLPAVLHDDLDGVRLQMVHRREDADPRDHGLGLVVFGHSHRPELQYQGSCLLLNPGACGPRRFSYPLTLAVLTIEGRRLQPEILRVE
ncbi:MAG TPA: metallophosphoesterase family protein [Thermoanaerobaculia bacterium]